MEQRDSVFLFGTGRSGTTLLLRMLASHPDLAWFSNLNEKMPSWPLLSMLSRFRNLDATSAEFKGWKRLIPMPAEAIEVPRYLTDGVFQTRGLLTSDDIDSAITDRYRDYLSTVKKWQGQERILHKHTGFARLDFLSQVDPGGRFVQIVRDGRAVAYSLMRVDWWSNEQKTWWGPMSEAYEHEFIESGEDPLVLAGIVWKHLLDVTAMEAEKLEAGRMQTVSYSEFVRQPREHMEMICQHCELDFSDRYQKRLDKFRIRDADEAWKTGLTTEEIDRLNRSLGDHLTRFGFEV